MDAECPKDTSLSLVLVLTSHVKELGTGFWCPCFCVCGGGDALLPASAVLGPCAAALGHAAMPLVMDIVLVKLLGTKKKMVKRGCVCRDWLKQRGSAVWCEHRHSVLLPQRTWDDLQHLKY